jgi:hypothetical protein
MQSWDFSDAMLLQSSELPSEMVCEARSLECSENRMNVLWYQLSAHRFDLSTLFAIDMSRVTMQFIRTRTRKKVSQQRTTLNVGKGWRVTHPNYIKGIRLARCEWEQTISCVLPVLCSCEFSHRRYTNADGLYGPCSDASVNFVLQWVGSSFEEI